MSIILRKPQRILGYIFYFGALILRDIDIFGFEGILAHLPDFWGGTEFYNWDIEGFSSSNDSRVLDSCLRVGFLILTSVCIMSKHLGIVRPNN